MPTWPHELRNRLLPLWFCLGGAWFVVCFVCFGGFSDLWTEPQILVLNLSFGLYPTSPRAGFWRVGSMDRTSNSGFEPFFWPLLYKPQSWFLACWIYQQNLKFSF